MSIQAVRDTADIEQTNQIDSVLKSVEDLLLRELESSVTTATAASRHILVAGGKRIRPTLVVTSAYACSDAVDRAGLSSIAGSAEIVHMATLMHDDVIDGAESRRGRVTANYRWGNQISVLTGDYMLARAFTLLAGNGDLRVMQSVSVATTSMTEGEIRQIESRCNPEADRDTYLAIIRDKTAAFMSACCRIGAIIAGAPSSAEDALADYGMNLGMAFQITDDLLDLVGDPVLTGKPIGGDVREGKVTLPAILARNLATPDERAVLDAIILKSDEVTASDVTFVRDLAERTGAIERTREAAVDFIHQAVAALRALPESGPRTALQDLAHSILDRKR